MSASKGEVCRCSAGVAQALYRKLKKSEWRRDPELIKSLNHVPNRTRGNKLAYDP